MNSVPDGFKIIQCGDVRKFLLHSVQLPSGAIEYGNWAPFRNGGCIDHRLRNVKFAC